MQKILVFLTLLMASMLFADPKEWTIMVFVNGDNDLDSYAFEDLNEMEEVGSNDFMNIIVQYDRYSSYGDANWSTARRYYVTQDDDMSSISSTLIQDIGEVDSGDKQSVVNFVQWAVNAYPAEKYALVLWDHGSGWDKKKKGALSNRLKGISHDETSGSSISVVNGDLEYILSKTVEFIGKPLDVLGMDACLMSMWEVHYVSAPYAHYFAGSEETEAGYGWLYNSWFQNFVDGEHTAENLCRQVSVSSIGSVGDTLSCVNLQNLTTLTTALNNFATKFSRENSIDGEILEASDEVVRMYTREHADLYDFFQKLNNKVDDSEITTYINPILRSIQNFVVENNTSSSFSAAKGVAIYLPIGTNYYFDSSYNQGKWSVDTSWNEFIQKSFQPADDHPNEYFTVGDNDKLDTSITASIEYSGDKDFFYFDALPNYEYTLETTLLTLDDSYLYLFDENGSEIASNDDITTGENRASRVKWLSENSQRVYVMVKAYGSESGRYTIKKESVSVCEPTNSGIEICDGLDNDCDGEIDNQDLDLCDIENGTGTCLGGKCLVDSCDENFYDIDNKSENGCEYQCSLSNNSVEICDGLDNDCNGIIDNGSLCEFNNGSGVCEEASCVLRACNDGFYNNNSSSEDGCEYQCEPTNGGLEICDGLDNNCNGNIDEGVCRKDEKDDGGCSYSSSSNSNSAIFIILLSLIITIFRKKLKNQN
ncbi:hypothetical protein JXR93_10580 [bacterium]|nr:hypothetical protein [bacterium]